MTEDEIKTGANTFILLTLAKILGGSALVTTVASLFNNDKASEGKTSSISQPENLAANPQTANLETEEKNKEIAKLKKENEDLKKPKKLSNDELNHKY
jgi:hypothetical protein